MDYSTDTDLQLRAALRSLRKRQRLNQTETGRLLGVSQMRIANIEAAPMKTSFEQMSRLVAALGARLVIDPLDDRLSENTSSYYAPLNPAAVAAVARIKASPLPPKPKRKTKADKLRAELENANW
jgi:HTH-type transcriptional regulator/antitoxin HipB